MPGRQPADAMTVLIVGGGYGGCVLAPKLEKAGFDVTLIERCECFFHKIGGGKAAVAPGYETKVTIPLSKLPVSKVLWAEATELDMSRKTLRVRHGGSGLFSYLPFDFLVIAVEQSHGFGQLPDRMLARDEILSFLRSEQSRVKQAQSVTIIGGGALGVETAAQVRQSHPATPVTLVHSSPQLMSAVQPPLSAAFTSTLHEKLVDNFGVRIRYSVPKGSVSAAGEPGELVLSCKGTGTRQSTRTLLPADWFDPQTGEIRVEPTLQVTGAPPWVFAIGDVAKTGDHKQARWAFAHAGVVARNLITLRSASARRRPSLATYSPVSRNLVPPWLLRRLLWFWVRRAVPESVQVVGLYLGEDDGLTEFLGILWNDRANRMLFPRDKGAASMARYLGVRGWDGNWKRFAEDVHSHNSIL